MAYNHGVSVSEVPTSIVPPVSVSAGIPFIVGTAPINMTDPSNVNKPVLCSSYAEAVAAFGYVPPAADSSGLKKYAYSISEFLYSQFALFGVGPAIIVNVLDPATHKTAATSTSVTLDAVTGSATIEEAGIIASTISLSVEGASAYTQDTDYVVSYDASGNLVIQSLTNAGGTYKCTTGSALTFSAQKLNPSAVDASDVIGGVDSSGNKSGFELIDECFPRFRLVPGILLAPGFSSDAGLAAIMAAKAANINGVFSAGCALIDVADSVTNYTGVAEWKNSNNITDPAQIVCWPKVNLGGVMFNLSTQLSGVLGLTDSNNNDVPYVSPSNHSLQASGSVLSNGTEVWLGPDNAAYLNGQGIATALNFMNGWIAFGNRTGAYPGVTDVKDSFIPVRRMFSWIGNTFIQTYWQQLDSPINRRLIDTIVDSANIWLNGLTARQFILGGRVEFLEAENPVTDLMDGIVRFHIYVTPASPARSIEFILEYDPSYLATLFD